MKAFCRKLVVAMVPLLFTAAAHAHMAHVKKGELSVSRDVVINHDSDKVWGVVGGFFALNEWHPAVAKVVLKEGGMVRILVLGNGAEVHERLLRYKDGRSYSYSLFKGPWPIRDYVGKIKVEPTGDNATKVTWSSTFNADDADEMTKTFAGIYEAGLQNLVKMMK